MANWLVEKLNDTALAYGERTALVSGGQEIRYRDLIRYVAGLAEKLTAMGVKKGDVCAVLCDRNAATVISVFAVWAVGGIYLPVDVDNPDTRNDYVIEQSRTRVVINASAAYECKTNFMARHSSVMVSLDYKKAEYDASGVADVLETDLAYVLFTSGSTGQPKGVKINHGNIRNLFNGLIDGIYSKFENGLNIALVAPFSFDVSIQQIVSSVLLGHTLHITRTEQRKNPRKLFDFLVKHCIHIFDCTPTHIKMFNGILAQGSIEKHSLKCIIIGGESLSGETVKTFAGKFARGCPFLVNIYGVTECTVDSIYNLFDPCKVEYTESVPIGIPMKGVEVAILDDRGNPVTGGEQGELYIGGCGVGSGYWDQTLNERSFVSLKAYPDVRFYRTGDFARVDHEGQIVCLGRNDRQVKIRGNRVELDEVEACIMRGSSQRSGKVMCSRCLLDSRAVAIGPDGVCEVCRNYEKVAGQLGAVFGSLDDFRGLLGNASMSGQSEYDCMLLYSGGKDSTYVLLRLIQMGYRVLAYTFDNGYLSGQAFDNIRRITASLGADSVIESFPKMDDVFSESIRRYHTVCDGCYKVLVTLSTKYAVANAIPAIVTGLDRGQIIETKLKGLLEQGMLSDAGQYLAEQRKAYHYWNKDFGSLQETPGNPGEIDRICFLDYFFYDSVKEADVLEQLDQSGIWKRSQDTGLCSTNCRVNDAGTAAFYKANGYHNYAAPLSWKIRLKQITREEGLAKISMEQFDNEHIRDMLGHLGLNTELQVRNYRVVMTDNRLTAFLDCPGEPDIAGIRRHLRNELPSYMMPYRFIVLRGFPVTESGKIDQAALAALAGENAANRDERVAADPVFAGLVEIWERMLGHSDFGMDDSFFDVGGDSLDAVLMSEEIGKQFDCAIPIEDMAEGLTIRGIAGLIRRGQEGLQRKK